MTWTVMPPPQYVHPPSVPVLEKRVTWAEMSNLCRAHVGTMLACSFFGKSTSDKQTVCFVFLPKESFRGEQLNLVKLRQHEIAHCNGWPGNHPGGHMEDVSMYPRPQRSWWKWW